MTERLGWGALTDMILTLLAFEPMTAAELADELGLDRRNVRRCCNRLVGDKLRVTAWRSDHPGQRQYPRPVYAIGAARGAANAKKPPPKSRARAPQVRQQVARLKSASVFNQGMSVRKLLT